MNQPALPHPEAAPAKEPPLNISASRNFPGWLDQQALSLTFTTYQVGKVFAIGLNADHRLSVVERTFPRCMGMTATADGQTLYLATVFQIWRFDNFLPAGTEDNGYDRLFVPQASWVTGDLDVHDMAVDADGRLIFVNTLFGCLSTPGEGRSFKPLWRPPFLSRLAAEDRCHLNGLAMRDGRPYAVTMVSRSDVAGGWRDRRVGGGMVMDVTTNDVLCEGLSMPHSPRWHDDRLWLHDSGTGFFGYVDAKTGRFERVAFCPGYLRGLAFSGKYAVVGLSKPRREAAFSGLPLDDELRARDGEPRCGLYVIDLERGDIVEWMEIKGVVSELYDVGVLPGARRPMVVGLMGDDVRRMVRFD